MRREMLAATLNEDIDIHKFYDALPDDIQSHCLRVSVGTRIMLQIAVRNRVYSEEFPTEPLELVQEAALYHDIGMTLIPERVLYKQEDLTPAERRVIQRHAGYGARLLDKYRTGQFCPAGQQNLWRLAAEIAVGHHERWDGKGYPFGIMATAVPLVARIAAIIDAYDAITRGTHYCMPLPHEYALVEIMDNAGTQFDPLLAELFLKYADEFHPVSVWKCGE